MDFFAIISDAGEKLAHGVAHLFNPVGPQIEGMAAVTGINIAYLQTGSLLAVLLLSLWLCNLVLRLAGFLFKNRSQDNHHETAAEKMRQQTGSEALSLALASVKGGFIAVGVFSLVINVLMLVSPLYMLQVYDRVLTSRSFETLIYLTVLAVSLIAFNALLELVRSRILVRVGARLDERLSEPVFHAIFKDNSAQIQGGTLPLSDLATVRNFLGGSGPNAFFDAPWTPIFIALIFLFHPLLGLIATIGAVLLFVIALVSEAATRNVYGKASGKAREASNFANATLRNAEVIRGMGMLPQLTAKWLEKNRDSLIFQNLANDRVGLLTSFSKLVRPILQIAMLGCGAFLVLQELSSPGIMIASSIIMGRALAPVESAVSQWRSFVAARASYGRLKETLSTQTARGPQLSLPKPKGHISVQSLTLVPPGSEKPVLHDVSFDIQPGEVLAVIGASAAGKSTLARALVGIWPPADGHVRLDGADLSQWIPEELGAHIGYLPQDVELFDGTVAENIARFTGLHSARIIEAAKQAGAHEMILHLTDGYDTQIGPQGCVLSGGQRQRVGLARALYNQPALIVLDEPNASLDSAGEKALMTTINHLRERGQTVVIISHRASILTAVDRVLILNQGRVEAFDKRESILPKLVGSTQNLRSVASPQQEPSSKAESKGTADVHHAKA